MFSMVCHAQVNMMSANTPTQNPDGHIYAYKKGQEQLFLTNIKSNNQTQKIHIAGKTIELPTSNTNTQKEIAIVPAGDNFALKVMDNEQDNVEYGSPDKRQVVYHEWEYLKFDNEFDSKEFKVARLLSNDYHATLLIGYDINDKQYQKPDVVLQLSGKLDDGVFHDFLCTQHCLNIDMNVDGKKYPNLGMKYGGGKTLIAKQPKTMLNHIKNGKTIKIRVRSVTGDFLIYEFEPEQALNLLQLKAIK